ncbi:MAG: hypothetical protein ACM3VS_01920 [Candidatus Dadabacteria bacterium]
MFVSLFSYSQKPLKETPAIDTSFTDYDLVFNELDAFLDSITAPRSFSVLNLSLTNNFFNYTNESSLYVQPLNRFVFTPSYSYFDKSGLGISGESTMIYDSSKINPYQYSITGSYDYLASRKFMTGVALTHFFTRNDLGFYTSPLDNEAYAYFTYRHFWIKPTIAASYGWGSRSSYRQREEYITTIQLAQRGYTRINTSETINDFNLTAAVRHDFYWLNLLSKKDYVRLTPQIAFVSGTQQFGFNQTSSTYATIRRTGANILYNSDKINLDNNLYFQPLSLSTLLKLEYSSNHFFIQPQVKVDYYFPAQQNNLSTVYVINAGVIF